MGGFEKVKWGHLGLNGVNRLGEGLSGKLLKMLAEVLERDQVCG